MFDATETAARRSWVTKARNARAWESARSRDTSLRPGPSPPARPGGRGSFALDQSLQGAPPSQNSLKGLFESCPPTAERVILSLPHISFCCGRGTRGSELGARDLHSRVPSPESLSPRERRADQ